MAANNTTTNSKMKDIFISNFIFIILIIMISLMASIADGISVRETFFQSEILPNCYKLDMQRKLYPLGQSSPMGPLGQSMENLISLIEKIEDYDNGRRLATTRPDVLARMLLSRFHIDEYNYLDHSGVYYQENVAATRNRLTEILLEASSSSTEPLMEEDWKTILTSDEKCSMYFMLSHNVNRTALPSDRRTYMSSPVMSMPSVINLNGRMMNGVAVNTNANNNNGNGNGLRMRANGNNGMMMTEEGREYGVVGFRNDESHAIAPARVLLGIIAANNIRLDASSLDVMKQVVPEVPTGFRESSLNVPLMVTLGDIWAYGAAPNTHEDREGINFGAVGTWNSTLCQVEYKLETNHTKGSLAEIRGAIDGYLLGMKAREVISKGNFKLSSLLRQYYSPTGLFDEFTSVCNRRRIEQESGGNLLKDNVRNYLSVLLRASRIPTDESRVSAFVDMTQKEFENAFREASAPIRADVDWCSKTRVSDPNGGICETPSDVVVVIDIESPAASAGDGLLNQMDIVKRISNELDMRRYGSSMTIVAATRNGGYLETMPSSPGSALPYIFSSSTDTLSKIVWNSTNRACVNCRISFADFGNFGSGFRNQVDQFFKYLNGTLRDLKRGKESLRLAASRPTIIFNYGSMKRSSSSSSGGGSGDRRSLDAAIWDLKANHRDVPILMVAPDSSGVSMDDLKFFASGISKNVFTIDPDVRGVVDRLMQRICETPAVLQHPSCRSETSSGQVTTAYITRGRKQYYAMYPEYFLKSFNVVFEIKAINGPIKVCYRRGYERPEEDERNCEKLDPRSGDGEGSNTRIIRSANPCYKFTLADCPAFYFTIIAPDEGSVTSSKCINDRCLNMDQVEWSVSHTGVSCNSISKLLSSIFLIYTLISLSSYLITNSLKTF